MFRWASISAPATAGMRRIDLSDLSITAKGHNRPMMLDEFNPANWPARWNFAWDSAMSGVIAVLVAVIGAYVLYRIVFALTRRVAAMSGTKVDDMLLERDRKSTRLNSSH